MPLAEYYRRCTGFSGITLSSLGVDVDPSTDYTRFFTTITFFPGVTSVMHTIVIANDSLQEPSETFQIALSNPAGAVLGNVIANMTIVDDDTWTIEGETLEIVEGNSGTTTAFMKLKLVNDLGIANHEHPIHAFVSLVGDTAGSDDYKAAFNEVIFAPGELEAIFPVDVIGDGTAEQHETVLVQLADGLGVKWGPEPLGQVTILNDDPAEASISPSSLLEGDSGEKMMVFTVSLSVPMNVPVSVSFRSIAETALEGADFQPISGELSFAPGETQKTISIPVFGDLIGESDEVFTVQLTNASGVLLGNGASAAGTIINDDPSIYIEDLRILEGENTAPGTHTVHVPIRLSKTRGIQVTVDFQTANGTALAGSDFVARIGSVTFAPGQTLQFIALEVVSDMIVEGDETFSLALSNAAGADIVQGTGVITIEADETIITTKGQRLLEGLGETHHSYDVMLSRPMTSAVTVNYATADGTAQAGSDYQAVSGVLTFLPGETYKTVYVPWFGDDVAEEDETYSLVLFEPIGAGLPGAVDR